MFSSKHFYSKQKYTNLRASITNFNSNFQTSFEGGEVVLTSHRILWRKNGENGNGQTCLFLALKYIVYFEEESPGALFFTRSKKIVLHLTAPDSGKTEIRNMQKLKNSRCN